MLCFLGLYFNKAADSCDYTQNVLCSKKAKATTTTTTTTSTTTEATSSSTTTTKATTRPSRLNIFSTQRVPLKITAATSRTTFSSTTAAPEVEYEVSKLQKPIMTFKGYQFSLLSDFENVYLMRDLGIRNFEV